MKSLDGRRDSDPSSKSQSQIQNNSAIHNLDKQEENEHEIPFLSVLNTVIDCKMMDPCPMDYPEFRHNIQVPVVRVFGPILKKGMEEEPLQSCCLYVHGAFPYLLARPTSAGPDGSSKCLGKEKEGYLDWDSQSAVQASIPLLQSSLENAIQASSENWNEKSSELPSSKKKKTNGRVIRRVTVVMGRGFYTYCPGPATAFLRVEYYDPSLRWKVKMCLERGLDLPKAYHPNPQQYDCQSDTTADVLSFHCYEAHIPHTMQFFKDYNLAGMAYIHLSEGGKFRSPLPKKSRLNNCNLIESRKLLFLQDNTSPQYVWNTNHEICNSDLENIELRQPSSLDTSQGSDVCNSMEQRESFWKTKETSCDVEFDCTVDHILNVQSVMTTVPSQQGVHWRAVPSLREIWRQERRRMSKLLSPEEDFLSQRDEQLVPTFGEKPQAFTLDVKRDASLPGSRLAVLGVKRLFDCSDGLDQQFTRAILDIIRRHSQEVDLIDKRLSSKNLKLENIAQTQDSYCSDDDNALAALEALKCQFDGVKYCASSQLSGSQSITSKLSMDQFGDLSQIFSQKVDRGESVIGDSEEQIEDLIDPHTLTIRDNDSEDDEDIDENHLERTLTLLASQMIPHNQKDIDSKHSPSESIEVTTMKQKVDWSNVGESSDSEDSFPIASTKDEIKLLKRDDTTTAFQKIGSEKAQARPAHLSEDAVFIPSTHPLPFKELGLEEVLPRSNIFHQIDRRQALPIWLFHASKYTALRSRMALHSVASSWGPRLHEGDFVVCRASRPPTRNSVALWCQKQDRVKAVANLLQENASSSKFSYGSLQIDSNSRKFVNCGTRKRIRSEAFADKKTSFTEIEEIEWESSQVLVSHLQSQRQPDEQSSAAEVTSVKSSTEDSLKYQSSVSQERSPASQIEMQNLVQALDGIGAQGGRIYIEGGGGLKSKTKPSPNRLHNDSCNKVKKGLSSLELPTPLTIMSIEIHVQCRTGKTGVNDSKDIAMKPISSKDMVSAVVYVYSKDPGGGEKLKVIERGCIFVPVEAELKGGEERDGSLSKRIDNELPPRTMGVASAMFVESARDEKQLLLRLASIVRWKDPDMLISWDTQGAGLGYLIERGALIGKTTGPNKNAVGEIDLARLLGRIPIAKKERNVVSESFFQVRSGFEDENVRKSVDGQELNVATEWEGSGLGTEWDERVGAGVAAASIAGRLVFSGWKLVAEEVKHSNASYLPAIVSSVLGKRIPFHDDMTLTQWYGFDKGKDRWRTINYRLTQALACLLVLDALDIVGRAGESARLSGVEFSQSFPGIRGSQYKVEGVMLRALKSIQSNERGSKKGRKTAELTKKSLSSEIDSQSQSPWKVRRGIASERGSEASIVHCPECSYFFFSPSVNDTNNQEALECQALTLEPRSSIEVDPVVVCDFTALYPSLVIAYNLCYSTCAGRLEYHSTRSEMRQEGRTTGKIGPFLYPESRSATVLKHHIKSVSENSLSELDEKYTKDRAYVVPTGTIYVSESVLKGVLPQVLDELLSTRAMLKKAAKKYKKSVPDISPAVLRQLEARQLALKYVANVTYGYTSATFSGRCAMPLLADSIVECGRRTLTNAINLATQWGKDQLGPWFGAEVIYGDTDSIFIKLPGRSVKEAFEFGEQFCSAVTNTNPPPIQLKLEKVYCGALMQTKKKYCGMKFESIFQKRPNFEGKGIETIRRDQCALTQKVLRNALVTLFQNGIDAVKSYLFRQWTLIMAGEVPVSDFILTGRVKMKYRGGRIGPVQAVLARRLAEADPGRVIRHKERLAYVIVATPGITFRLRDCVLTPNELLEQWDAYTIHSAYYITKHVNAALQRCFGLAPYHIDINAWFESCPKPRKRLQHWPITRSGSSLMISSYFGSDICSLCGKKCKAQGSSRVVVCAVCREDPIKATATAFSLLNKAEKEAKDFASLCGSCNGCFEDASTFATLKPVNENGRKQPTLVKTSVGILTPIANCICIDCPTTFHRHRCREAELEARSTCEALGLL